MKLPARWSYLSRKNWTAVLIGLTFLGAGYYLSTKNYLLFHTFAELFTVIISFSIALIVFNNYKNLTNDYIPIIGIAYAFAGIFDLLHTLAYQGLGVFSDDGANLATQMWIIARYLDGIGMLLAGLSFYKTIKSVYVLATYVIVSISALVAVFYWQVFPVCFIEGQGLTPFKICSEYVISAILTASILLLMRHKDQFHPKVYRWLLGFYLTSICTELVFTLYRHAYGLENLIGHLFKVTAFFFLYRAIVETSIQEPSNLFFYQLNQANAQLQHYANELAEKNRALLASEDQLAKYMCTIQDANAMLEDVNAILEEEISERQAAEEALRKSRDELMIGEEQMKHYAAELAATNKELKSFANIIAHDFRSPMVNLKGFSKELDNSLADLTQILHESRPQLPENVQRKVDDVLKKEVPDALQFINSSVDKLDRMVAALLNLARLGRREIVYKEVDVNELVKGVLYSLAHQIEQKEVQVSVKALPRIESDFLAIEQIISNLLDNSLKYLDSSRRGDILIDCIDNGDEYLFSVQDNGRGIADEDQEKIFEIFRRAGKQDVPGDGMGLAYVRTLTRQLGGQVWCESEPGVGTKMLFTVPKRPYTG